MKAQQGSLGDPSALGPGQRWGTSLPAIHRRDVAAAALGQAGSCWRQPFCVSAPAKLERVRRFGGLMSAMRGFLCS